MFPSDGLERVELFWSVCTFTPVTKSGQSIASSHFERAGSPSVRPCCHRVGSFVRPPTIWALPPLALQISLILTTPRCSEGLVANCSQNFSAHFPPTQTILLPQFPKLPGNSITFSLLWAASVRAEQKSRRPVMPPPSIGTRQELFWSPPERLWLLFDTYWGTSQSLQKSGSLSILRRPNLGEKKSWFLCMCQLCSENAPAIYEIRNKLWWLRNTIFLFLCNRLKTCLHTKHSIVMRAALRCKMIKIQKLMWRKEGLCKPVLNSKCLDQELCQGPSRSARRLVKSSWDLQFTFSFSPAEISSGMSLKKLSLSLLWS